ncbi:MAG TPA: Ig-like domain-containing protein, partial [Thermoanaerobaculia bacterium]
FLCPNAPCRFAWDFGDGRTGTGAPISHDYGTAFGNYGAFTATVTVADALDARTTASTSFTMYPASAHPYANNLRQTWAFTQPGHPSSIDVTFGRTSVEAGFDYIYVMDKNGNNISGSPFTGGSLAGTTRRIAGDTVQIRLTSDLSVTAFGFEVVMVTAVDSKGSLARGVTASITSPSDGATISGTTRLTASASSGREHVSKMELYIDDSLVASGTSPTLSYAWDTSGASSGSHIVVSKAYDGAKLVSTSSGVAVTVIPADPRPKGQTIRRQVSRRRSG